MTIKTRLTKLETILDATTCPVCGNALPPVAEAKAKCGDLLRRYVAAGLTRADAIVRLSEAAPTYMYRAGFLQSIPEGFCAGCGKAPRPVEEIARELLARYTAALHGDQDAALVRLREHAPTVATYLN